MEVAENLNNFFEEKIKSLSVHPTTQSYITQIFTSKNLYFLTTRYSNESLTLSYSEAKFNPKFQSFQDLGDWILVANSMFSKHLKDINLSNYIAQNCYFTCYRLLQHQWPIFEELADMFPEIVKRLREKIGSSINSSNYSMF